MGVKIRAQYSFTRKAWGIWLDVYHQGHRHWEKTGLFVSEDYTKKSRIKPVDKEIWLQVQEARSARERELVIDPTLLTIGKGDADLIMFFSLTDETGAGKTALSALREYCKSVLSIERLKFAQVNEEWLEAYKAWLLLKVSSNTAADYLRRLQTVWRKAIHKKIVMKNPFTFLEKPKMTKPQREYLTESELRAVEAATPNPDDVWPIVHKAFLFSCYTSLRWSDVSPLLWSDVKIEENSLQYFSKKTKRWTTIPLADQAKTILSGLPKTDGRVFDGLPSASYVNIQLKALAAAAGLKKVLTFHVARHTFATYALTKDVPLEVVQSLLDHKSIATTQIYARVIDKKKQEAITKMWESK